MSQRARCSAIVVDLGPDAVADRVMASAAAQQDVDLDVVTVRDGSLSQGARLNLALSRCSTDYVVVMSATERIGAGFVRRGVDALRRAASSAKPRSSGE